MSKGKIENIMEERVGILRALQLIVTLIMLPVLGWLGLQVIELGKAVTSLSISVAALQKGVTSLNSELDKKIDTEVFELHEKILVREIEETNRRVDSNVKRLDVYGMDRRSHN